MHPTNTGGQSSNESTLAELQAWYASHCDGKWEHQFGVGIGNIDNPGWILDVGLTGTELAEVDFPELKENYDHETEWIICGKQDGRFVCNGGPLQLERMIRIFLDWAKAHSGDPVVRKYVNTNISELEAQMESAEWIMRRDYDALRELAK